MFRALVSLSSVAVASAGTGSTDANGATIPSYCTDDNTGAAIPCGGNTLVNNAVRNTCPACNDGVSCLTTDTGNQSPFSVTTVTGSTYNPAPLLLNGVSLADPPVLGFVDTNNGQCGTDATSQVLTLKITNDYGDKFAVWIGDSKFSDAKQSCDYNANYAQVSTIDPATGNLAVLGASQGYPYGVGPNDDGAGFASIKVASTGTAYTGPGSEFTDPSVTLTYTCTAASCCAWMACLSRGDQTNNPSPTCDTCCSFKFALSIDAVTPSPSPSQTPSGSPSVSGSPSMTPTTSTTITVSQTPSPATTPTQTKSPGATSSVSPTVSPTTSRTPSTSPTSSRTTTVSGTPSRSASPSSSPASLLAATRSLVKAGSVSFVKLPAAGTGTTTLKVVLNVTDPYTTTTTYWACDNSCTNYVPGFNATPANFDSIDSSTIPFLDKKTNLNSFSGAISGSCQSPAKWICAGIYCTTSSSTNKCSYSYTASSTSVATIAANSVVKRALAWARSNPKTTAALALAAISVVALVFSIFFCPNRLIGCAARCCSGSLLACFSSFVRCGRKAPAGTLLTGKKGAHPPGAPPHYAPVEPYGTTVHIHQSNPAAHAVVTHHVAHGNPMVPHPPASEHALPPGWARYEDESGDVWFANVSTGAWMGVCARERARRPLR